MSSFNETQPANRILRLKQVVEYVGLSRSTIYDILDPNSKRYDPTFPRQVKLSIASVGWVAGEIEIWIESKIAQRE